MILLPAELVIRLSSRRFKYYFTSRTFKSLSRLTLIYPTKDPALVTSMHYPGYNQGLINYNNYWLLKTKTGHTILLCDYVKKKDRFCSYEYIYPTIYMCMHVCIYVPVYMHMYVCVVSHIVRYFDLFEYFRFLGKLSIHNFKEYIWQPTN